MVFVSFGPPNAWRPLFGRIWPKTNTFFTICFNLHIEKITLPVKNAGRKKVRREERPRCQRVMVSFFRAIRLLPFHNFTR